MLGLAVARAFRQQANHQVARGQHFLDIAFDQAVTLVQGLPGLGGSTGLQMGVFACRGAKALIAAHPQLRRRHFGLRRLRHRQLQRHVDRRSSGGLVLGVGLGLLRHVHIRIAPVWKVTHGFQPQGLDGVELGIGNNAKAVDRKRMTHPADFQLDIHTDAQRTGINQDRCVHT
ncbi:hypothetical protein D3C78_1180610 [compost metagenome]